MNMPTQTKGMSATSRIMISIGALVYRDLFGRINFGIVIHI